ncbi:MAG: SPFH domain-containing protein [Planctomycetota bacterium]
MRRLGLYLLAGTVLVFLLAYTMTYTVRFTEAGVRTQFGRVSSTELSPGLKFKLPYPIQSVTTYDIRTRVTQVKLETVQTKDSRQIVVESYCIWKVSDPLKFFERFSNAGPRAADHFRAADDTVKSNLRSALGAISKYEFSSFFNPDPKLDGLADLENDVLASLIAKNSASAAGTENAEARGNASLASVGIEVTDVGVSQVVLPQETTTKVFDRMSAARDRIAKKITSQAEAEAVGIKSRAALDSDRIKAFALQRAADITRKGDEEAKQFFDMMKSNPRLAVFLTETQMLREAYGRKGTTLVLPWDLPGFRLLRPDASKRVLKDGEIVAPQLGKAAPASPEAPR